MGLVLALLTTGLARGPAGSIPLLEVLFWASVVAVADLLPVPAWRDLRLSLGFPILLGVAILYSPPIAAAVAFLGTFDIREIRREVTALKALFNRAQIALSVLAGSAAFHAVASVTSPWYQVVGGGLLATAVDYGINTSLVTSYLRLVNGIPLRTVLSRLRVGALSEFLVSYVGLGLVGIVIARLYIEVGAWSVAAFILPLLFARQVFFRSMALEEAHKELKDREEVLRALSNRMAEERQDERAQIAAYLHDDLAQTLFRLTLQIEVAKKRLLQGDLAGVSNDLDGINNSKSETSAMVRSLIKDLHRSPIGRAGLAEAIQSFGQDITRDSTVAIATDVVEVSLPPPIQLLIYQIAREAAMNALKHAEPTHIWISLHETEDGVELQIRDDGKGFDTDAPAPEGHFGTVMMRERAQVTGGKFSITSEPGRGTMVSASFPRVWVEEGSKLESDGRSRGEPPVARETRSPQSPRQSAGERKNGRGSSRKKAQKEEQPDSEKTRRRVPA